MSDDDELYKLWMSRKEPRTYRYFMSYWQMEQFNKAIEKQFNMFYNHLGTKVRRPITILSSREEVILKHNDMNTNYDMQSLGQARVRVDFNPDNNTAVNNIKKLVANLIDETVKLRDDVPVGDKYGEANRLVALAITAFEEGGMWAVKAATISK